MHFVSLAVVHSSRLYPGHALKLPVHLYFWQPFSIFFFPPLNGLLTVNVLKIAIQLAFYFCTFNINILVKFPQFFSDLLTVFIRYTQNNYTQNYIHAWVLSNSMSMIRKVQTCLLHW